MLDVIRDAWGWIGLDPERIEAANSFGNVVVRDRKGAYWRICPEELSCEVIASSGDAYEALWNDEEFLADWNMDRIVEIAKTAFGTLPDDRCYCLKVPGVVGGKYDGGNIETISRAEAIRVSGDFAEQISDLPDGQEITIEIVG